MDPLDVRDVDERLPEDGADAPDEARAGHLGFVAHEVRNPLSTALWTAELLARLSAAERGGARGEKLSAMCLRSIVRVRQLVEDHFLCERLDAGGYPLRVEAVVLADAVGAVLERRPADASPASVEIDPGLTVLADRTLLERAIEGIVAVAGAEKTSIAISARGAERDVALAVSGRPADPAALADPMKGAPSDPTGRALSLPLARRIARVLGGALSAAGDAWRLSLATEPAPAPAGPPGAT